MKKILTGLLAAGLLTLAGVAQATTLTTKINTDNQFWAYLSTDDTVQGTQFGTGNYWPSTYTHSTALVDGVTNYLHIYGLDSGGPEGMLGEFSLSDTNFSFANGLQTLLSGDAALRVSATGWGGYGPTVDKGQNGVSPWGSQSGINSGAHWVWSTDSGSESGNRAYFSVAIRSNLAAVPLPAAMPMLALGLGLLGAAARRGRNRKKA